MIRNLFEDAAICLLCGWSPPVPIPADIIAEYGRNLDLRGRGRMSRQNTSAPLSAYPDTRGRARGRRAAGAFA